MRRGIDTSLTLFGQIDARSHGNGDQPGSGYSAFQHFALRLQGPFNAVVRAGLSPDARSLVRRFSAYYSSSTPWNYSIVKRVYVWHARLVKVETLTDRLRIAIFFSERRVKVEENTRSSIGAPSTECY